MNWENNNFSFDEDSKPEDSDMNKAVNTINLENEQKKAIQLEKYQDPQNNAQRQTYISILAKFGELLVNNDKQEITSTLMTGDCEVFLFNFGEVKPAQYSVHPGGFITLCKDLVVIEREVKDTYVDVEKATAMQVCSCKLRNEKDQTITPQYSFELFSFNKDNKILKYRASFGIALHFQELQNALDPSKKARMLAKVKELNYAWAGESDLEKIASLLHESIEYKIWSWDDFKMVTLYKHDFAMNFKGLEVNYTLKCVVPYEVYSEGQFIMGTYVYHLEGKNALSGKKFVWLTTCIYTFDKDLNIIKIIQQGELHPEGEIAIPFEVYSRERLSEKVNQFHRFPDKKNSDLYCSEEVQFSFDMLRFGPSYTFATGHVKGFSEYHKFSKTLLDQQRFFEWAKGVDMYVDLQAWGYDVVVLVDCVRGVVNKEDYAYHGIVMNFYSVRQLSFENGRLSKIVMFFSEIPEVIPTPYDDSFTDITVKHKKDLL